MNPIRVTALSGSLRAASYSSAIVRGLAELFPAEVAVEVNALPIGDIPHYNQDLEDTALPAIVAAARRQVANSDLVVIVTPEFNHGLPGVLKNTLDWLSRPAFTSCMVDKPVLFITLSPGALGGVRAQYQLRETLSSMLCRLYPLPEIAITQAGAKIVDGVLRDEATRGFITATLGRLLAQLRLAA